MRCLAVTSAALLAATAHLAAQGVWRPPQPPCDLKAGHFRVSTAVSNLKIAVEKPIQRDRMLSQTLEVLTRTITGDGQDKNPAAWYWLGRTYAELGDASGADSAFRRAAALAPTCAADIDFHRGGLWEAALALGQQLAGAGNVDSAAVLLRRAYALLPGNPRPLFILGDLYARTDRVDSATAYLQRAAAAARSDTAYAAARKAALESLARLLLRQTQSDATIQGWSRTRFSRDSIDRVLIADSVVLGRINASAQSRKARGARLTPADQAAFSRDSTTRAEALARDRAGRTAIVPRVTADSAAAQPGLAPAIAALRDFLTAYPDAVESVTPLAVLYAQSGRIDEGRKALQDIYSGQDGRTRLDAGLRAVRGGLTSGGATLLESGLKEAPFDRDALNELANAYRAQRDGDRMLAASQRLLAIDPLNGTALRLVGTAWDLGGNPDSARKYLGAPDTMTVEITVGSFIRDGDHYILSGVVGNRQPEPSPALTLTFEFLTGAGIVAATNSIAIPSLPAAGSQDFSVTVSAKDLNGWRYRPS
jgi:tetratricopeptide (TPR) repeat protein